MTYLKEYKSGVCLELHIQPKASRTAIRGLHGESLKISVQAPPSDGAANEALRRFLADLFDRPFREVEILRGEGAREKSVFIPCISLKEAADKIAGVLP